MKKIVSLFFAVVLVFNLCACSATATKEKPVLTIQRSEHESFTYNKEQPVIEELEKRLNIDIQLETYPSADYNAKLNIQLGTDDLPDIVLGTYTSLAQYAAQGMFVNLSEHMDKLPNYKATLEKYETLANAFKVDGDMYWFIQDVEKGSVIGGDFPMVRKDILEDIGWEKAPDNFEELYEMLKAIKEYDPNSIPFVTRGTSVLSRMGYSFGTYNNIYFEPDEGKYLYGPIYDHYRDFLEYLNRFYTEGLLDPDFASFNKSMWMEYLTSGKSFFFFDNSSFSTDINLVTKSVDPEAAFVPMLTLENNYGSRRNRLYEGCGVSPLRNDVWAISSNCENLDAALAFMDYLYSDEGAMLCSYGIEGVNYDVLEDGTIEFDQEKIDWYKNNANDPYREYCNEIGVGVLAVAGKIYSENWYEFLDQDSLDMLAFWEKDEYLQPYSYSLCLSAEDTAAIADISTACSTLVSSESLKFITGTRPLSEFGDFVEELKAAGAETIEEVYNKTYQSTLN